ncbi:IS3 family transposase [Bifidobacterium pullorum]|uniref:IS3 family transposase n=1 Tax=Bifidobacterium pullorum TaxID=78448 RepID=UPI0030B95B62
MFRLTAEHVHIDLTKDTSSYHYHRARLGVDRYAGLRACVARAFADSRGRYGYRRFKAALGTGVSEKVIRRIMREDGLVARVPGRRRYSSYEGEVTPAPDNLVNRDFTAERPNEKWLTDTTRDQGQRRKGVPFADDRLLRRHGRGAHGRDVAERRTGQHDAGSGPPPRCGPASVPWSTVTAVVITGGRDGWNGWAGTAWSGPRARRGAAPTTPRPRGSSAV